MSARRRSELALQIRDRFFHVDLGGVFTEYQLPPRFLLGLAADEMGSITIRELHPCPLIFIFFGGASPEW